MISWNGRFSFAFNSVAASIRKLCKIKLTKSGNELRLGRKWTFYIRSFVIYQ